MERLDVSLVKKGLAPSRSKAIELIKNKKVKVDGVVVVKPSTPFHQDAKIEVDETLLKYVSRGGFKLEKAIVEFGLDFKDKIVLDMGSSTGGFTDCALQHGAKFVYAVDVGSNQLAQVLLNDSRVESKENTDVRTLPKTIFDKCDIVVADISFVSEVLILGSIIKNITSQDLIILIKPQFECGLDVAKKNKGVIKDYKESKKIADDAINKIKALGYNVVKVTDSPITGGDGNHEFIVWLKNKA